MKHKHLYLLSLMERNSKRTFAFMRKKRWKMKIAFSIYFAERKPLDRCLAPQHGVLAPPSFFPRHCTQHLNIKPPQVWTVWASGLYLNLSCASVSKVCPKITVSSLYLISSYKGFHRTLQFQTAGETYIKEWGRTSKMMLTKDANCWHYGSWP